MEAFVTPAKEEYYSKVMRIVRHISDTLQSPVYIYGGFLRNIIEGQEKVADDIDLWIDAAHSETSWSRAICHLRGACNFMLSSMEYYNNRSVDYGLYRTVIDGLRFDISAPINGFNIFKNLSDFTCNNLYCTVDGVLNVRYRCAYSLVDHIEHIRQRRLVDITNWKFIEHVQKYLFPNTDYYAKMAYRRDKMLAYGYEI